MPRRDPRCVLFGEGPVEAEAGAPLLGVSPVLELLEHHVHHVAGEGAHDGEDEEGDEKQRGQDQE